MHWKNSQTTDQDLVMLVEQDLNEKVFCRIRGLRGDKWFLRPAEKLTADAQA